MNKYIYLPTWLIMRSAWPFLPKSHFWKMCYRKPFSLENWAKGATDLTKEFSIMLWISGGGAALLIYIVLAR